MALDQWWRETEWPHLREGQALFDVRLIAGNFRTHHAMLVRAASAQEAKVMEGFRVRVTHMRPPISFNESDPKAIWPLSDTTYLGSFSGPSFDDGRYRRVVEEMRRVENRAASSGGGGTYSLANLGDDEDDPNNPGETVDGPHRSCASLVEGCYKKAGVRIVDESNLPRYYSAEIYATFSPHDAHNNPTYKEATLRRMLPKIGLALDCEPWPLLLPAYQMLAFHKGDATQPYRAEKTDHPFRLPPLSAGPEASTPTSSPVASPSATPPAQTPVETSKSMIGAGLRRLARRILSLIGINPRQ